MITLLTDFGLSDPYGGIMKGVVLSINPSAAIVDLTHDIPPQDIHAAAYAVSSAFPYFPKGTIHIVVVDPGVGGNRKILALSAAGHIFLAPDNGVLTLILENCPVDGIFSVENDRYFRQPVSCTFHGRDIFAPVAGHLSNGLPLEKLGPAVGISGCVMLDMPRPRVSPGRGIEGEVIQVDRFGNLITNIPCAQVAEALGGIAPRHLNITICGHTVHGLSRAYADTPGGSLLALCGSSGRIEISVSGGNAAVHCGAGRRTRVVMTAVQPDANQ